ncbi:MAG: hypothetical protein K0R65_2336 [Crocinitomicaceae bacterium]|jgi:hypothetical protein|nr:hypothetical protein [Crocinitomicaceae bacterium]
MEKSCKDILREGEEAYNPQAWENVSRRLDQSMPVKGKAFSPKNILLGGSAALLIGAGLYFLAGNNEQAPAQKATGQKTEQLTQNELPATTGHQQNTSSEEESEMAGNNQKEAGKAGKSEKSSGSDSAGENLLKKEENFNPLKDHKEPKDPELKTSDPVKPVNTAARFILPKHASEYCLNEDVELSNTNENRCMLTDDSGNVIASIAGNSKTKVQLSKTGVYFFRYPKFDQKSAEAFETERAFTVHGPQTPDFSFENEINYDNGIPYINLKAQDFGNGMSWNSDKGEIVSQAENSKISVFRKGDYRVSLEKKDQQGCTAKKVQVISVREDYNLLAPTAFRPASNDPRNSRFMPFALTVRNTGFELLVIDPETGRTVFKSTSADNAWDGADMNSEQSDKANKAYIWKVKLHQPERGEKSEYSGTVMRLIQ